MLVSCDIYFNQVPASVAVPEKMKTVKGKYDELCEKAEERKKNLEEAVTFHIITAEVSMPGHAPALFSFYRSFFFHDFTLAFN